MLDSLLATIAPYHCICCGFMGVILCQRCKKGISKSQQNQCGLCGYILAAGWCQRPDCGIAGVHQYVALAASDTTKKLIHAYKYQHKRAVSKTLADLVARQLPQLAQPGYCLCPIPPSNHHVRQRGFSHTGLLVRQLARQYGLPRCHILQRHGRTQQVGAGRTARFRQQHGAYTVRQARLRRYQGYHYALVDDVMTTGATMQAAVAALQSAGVEPGNISLLAIMHQPLG